MDLKELRISDKKIEVLATLGIHYVQDLLSHYPFRYEEITRMNRTQWRIDQKICIEGLILTRARVIRFKGKQSITKFKLLFEEEEFDVTIYNRPWVSNFVVGKSITLIAKYEGNNRITALLYNFKPLEEQLGIHPVYNVKDGITHKEIERYINKAWLLQEGNIIDFIPAKYVQKYRLLTRREALFHIHHPKHQEALKQSLRHLKYEEFLKFQLAMQAIKANEKDVVYGHQKRFSVQVLMQLHQGFDYELTKGQEAVIEEILHDLRSERVMYRMVQGDVGCGKTLVAAFGMYACVLSHKQAAFMAPTEILAKQHCANLKALFKDLDVNVDVLYGSLKANEKRDVLKQLKEHKIDIIIGTHALFQEDVDFYDLGMVVADEQHRFGVAQRRRLLEKGDKVDFLLMSATPIPRTLAISLYGDMDVSTIQELPKGRMKIVTKLIQSKSMSPILDDVLERIDAGNQCYVVCPAIDKNEDYEMRNVMDIYEGMCASIGRKYCIGLLHGKMNAQQKDEIMERFAQGEIQILVSTTVIEVGVDVKNANIMVIYDAHRFGMSQIHQLRGRVGRGEKAGFCYLLTSSQDPDSLKRLALCEQTSDGFEIARYDLQLRGPGDILGTRQSGVPGFILGDLIQDASILEVARVDASEILQHLECEEYANIREYIQEMLQHHMYVD